MLDDMSTRYGIHTTKAFGVGVGTIQKLAKQLGRDHASPKLSGRRLVRSAHADAWSTSRTA